MDLGQIRQFEKLIKRFKMKPAQTIITVIFLLLIFTAACFFGAGYLTERGRQLASNIKVAKSVDPQERTTTSKNIVGDSILLVPVNPESGIVGIVMIIVGAVGIFSLLVIGFILVRNFLFPKYIWDEKLRAFRNPRTGEILCSNCKGKIVLEKDKGGLFRICPKCGMVQEPLLEEQKKALRDIVSTVIPHKDRKKKAIRVSILNRSKKL